MPKRKLVTQEEITTHLNDVIYRLSKHYNRLVSLKDVSLSENVLIMQEIYAILKEDLDYIKEISLDVPKKDKRIQNILIIINFLLWMIPSLVVTGIPSLFTGIVLYRSFKVLGNAKENHKKFASEVIDAKYREIKIILSNCETFFNRNYKQWENSIGLSRDEEKMAIALEGADKVIDHYQSTNELPEFIPDEVKEVLVILLQSDLNSESVDLIELFTLFDSKIKAELAEKGYKLNKIVPFK